MEIHVLLTGRLGNQLFQYAFAKYLQKQYGGLIYLNVYDLEHRSGNRKSISSTKFNYDMKDFNLDSDVIIEDIKMPWYADLSNPIIRVIKKICPNILFNLLAKKGYLLWQRSDYKPIPYLNCDCIFAHGYWQDIRYLNNISNELRQMIVPKNVEENCNNELVTEIESCNSVCISVRGGNYLNPKIKKDLFVCDNVYFINAVKQICNYVDNPVFFVFSDDINWAKQYINFDNCFPNHKFIYESGSDSVAEKIRLMMKCKNYIISNSSFSWWAQFLCDNRNKIVIAPDRWFTNGNRCGLYMDNWILVDTSHDE